MKELVFALSFAALLANGAEVVSRDIGDPEANLWEEGGWPTTPGEFQVLDARPDDPNAPRDHKALRLICRYGAYSFGGWNAHPKPQTLPGKVVKITGWARKGNEKSWGMGMNFVDANTNKFSYGIPAKSTDWEPFEFVIPEMVNGKDPETGKQVKVPIKFPIKLDSVSQNNWGDRNNPEPVERILDLYDLRVHTDMGGIPVDRANSGALVRSLISEMKTRETFHLAIAPEGTRKPVKRWKTGYHLIAREAGVPVYLGYFDWGRKEIGHGPRFECSDDAMADLRAVQAFYKQKGVQGKHPGCLEYL